MPVFAATLDLSSLVAAQGLLIQGAPNGSAASVVAAVGDFNGDGRPDYLIGAPFADPAGRADAGAAWLVFGAASPGAAIDLSNFAGKGLAIQGARAGDLAGWSVAGIGDINGDGKADIAVGAPLADTGSARPGATYVVFGSNGGAGTLSLADLNGANGFRIKGLAGNDGQGYSVASAGDMNNDGFGDLVISAPQADPLGRDTAGAVYVVYGKAGGFGAELDLATLNGANGFRVQGAADGDGLGEAVAAAGDIDGDGFDDLLIGAAGASPGGRFEAGSVYILYGAAGAAAVVDMAAPAARVTRIDGQAGNDGLGDAVAAAGDVNGDGYGDFLIGAPGADAGGRIDSGSAFLIYGRAGGLGATLALSGLGAGGVRLDGPGPGALAGAALAAGDLNGDGLTDLLVGAPGADIANRTDNGAIYALLTNVAGFPAAFDLAGLNASYGSVFWGAANGDGAGGSLSSAGDLNGDGYADFLVGAQFGGPGDGGAAYVIYGGPSSEGVAGLVGDAGPNTLTGGPGNEVFRGQGGDDRLVGGGGLDTAAYQGRAADYAWWRTGDGSWRVQDLRTGSPEGLDTLAAISQLQFADRTIKIAGASTLEQLTYAFENVLRKPATSQADQVFIAGLAALVTSGGKTLDQAYADIVARADPSTAVAAMSYQFFTGSAPSKGGFDFLVSPDGPNPNNLNSAYYQAFNYENRFINFAVNLGKTGEGAAAFAAEYGALTLSGALTKAYAEIFGLAPSAARVDAILNATFQLGGLTFTRADYFAMYGGDGLAGLGTKAAMVGFLMAAAVSEDVGVLARSSNAYLADLADGAPFRVDLVGTYAQPGWAYGDG